MMTVAIEGAPARTHTSGLSPAYHVPTSQSLFNPSGTCSSNSFEPIAYQTSPVRLLEGVDTPSVSAHTNEVTRPQNMLAHDSEIELPLAGPADQFARPEAE